jgi:hypothetical protein
VLNKKRVEAKAEEAARKASGAAEDMQDLKTTQLNNNLPKV